MFLYNLNIAKANFPFETLTYSSATELQTGQICSVEIRDVILFGIVKEKSNLLPEQIKNLKPIIRSFNFCLSPVHLEFLNKIAFLTFNSFNNLFLTLTIPLSSIKNLETWQSKKLATKTKDQTELKYIISKDWDLIIKELITKYLKQEKTINILIIHPQKNSLEKAYNALLANADFVNKIQVFNLLTTSNKKLLPILTTLYNIDYPEEKKPKIKVIFGNKNTLFSSLDQIDHIIIADEANPSYISEQRIYFDAREVAFFASLVYSLNLTFISTLPSVRFYQQNKAQLATLKIPKLQIKFLERTTRQSDFENILTEINEGGLIVGNDCDD